MLRILDACATLFPSPEGTKVEGVGKDGKPVEIVCDEKGHAVAQVFKTVSDPFAGRISLPPRRSGHFQSDGTYWNATKSAPERFSGLFLPQGKEHVNVPEAQAGDIVAVAKLKETATGDTLTSEGSPGRSSAAVDPGGVDRLRDRAERRRGTRTRSRPPSTS